MSTIRRRATALVTVLAAGALALGGQCATASADTLPTPEQPGGLADPHSPGGIPSAGDGPVFHTYPIAQMTAASRPGLNPQGANDFSCTSLPGRRPVVLVPGTSSDAFGEWSWIAPMLERDGWCVFTFNYNPSTGPLGALQESSSSSGDIRSSAAFLAGFVDQALERTGASQVDLVGHSQGGGPLPRAYLKWYGGAAKVHQLVGIAPSNHGTTVGGLQKLIEDTDQATDGWLLDYATQHNMLAIPEQLSGSDFLTSLNEGGDTLPGVEYTVIATRNDATVTPYTSQFLSGDQVTNETLQDFCPLDPISHPGAPYDGAVYQLVRNALDPSTAQQVNCLSVPTGIPPTA